MIVFDYDFFSIAVPIVMCLFFIAIFPIMRRFSARYYLLKLGVNSMNAANYNWLHIQSLYSHSFMLSVHRAVREYTIFFRPNEFLSIPASINEGLSSRKDTIDRTVSLTSGLSDAQKKEWSKFFQRAGIFNICAIMLFLMVTAIVLDSPWWIFCWICAGAYIMSLYALYAILFYVSVAKIQIPRAPKVLQEL
jgi:hypothetical protein